MDDFIELYKETSESVLRDRLEVLKEEPLIGVRYKEYCSIVTLLA